MTKRRQSKTTATRTATKPKAKAKVSRKASGIPAKKVARSRGRVAESSDDIKVFIPRSVVRAAAATVPADDDDDDTPVFIAKAGAPVEVQSDFVYDSAHAAEYRDSVRGFTSQGMTDDEILNSLDAPRATTANGWKPSELTEHGLRIGRGGAVECRYGCAGTTSKVPGVSFHRYDCVYWQREGSNTQPF